jgi:outer membrane protein assembly factor BamB
LSSDGINEYGGSIPRPISLSLDEKYVSGKAGTDGRRYYISLYNGTDYNLYVYDTLPGIKLWHREDNLQVKDFANMNGVLYALAADNKVYRFDYGTEVIEWEVETDTMTQGYMGKKYSNEIKVEAEMEEAIL